MVHFFKMFKNLFSVVSAKFVFSLKAVALTFSYIKDYVTGHYFGTIKNGRHEDGTPMPEFFGFVEKFHVFPYYFLMFFLVYNWSFFHFSFFAFLLAEIFILLIRPFFDLRLVVRSFIFSVFIFVFYKSSKYNDEGLSAMLLVFGVLEKITGANLSNLANAFNELVEIDFSIYFLRNYFLTITLPYICAGLILVLPLVSCLSLFSFGFLIGYELAGIFSSILISISFFSSCYLMFIFPHFRALFAQSIKEKSPYSWDSEFDKITKNWDYTVEREWSPIEKELIDSNYYNTDVNIVQMLNCDNFYLTLDFGNFINTPFFWSPFIFVVDSVSIIVVFVVTFISSIVHFYSIVYMKNDPHKVRFFSTLSLFTFFMIILVLAGNLIMLYIGWEGVGLSSFLLISFWYTRVTAVKAALKAILVNKIGDLLIIVAAGLITFYTKGSTLISNFFFTVPERAAESNFFCNFTVLDLIACSLVISAFVKSAQIFFHTWLADAMEGPTPVSALLHAATMVTAGVYLVIRFSSLIEFSFYAKALLFFGGFFTIVFSSLVACTQYDIKKIIAYSTCSQLGLMFFACGLSAYDLALFHFFNHAFFKCLLFLLAGIIIHELQNEQDIRKMGGLAIKMPFVFLSFTLASLSLVGFPGFSGAVSKDLILHLANYSAAEFFFSDTRSSLLLFFTNIMIYLTMAYSFRLMYYVFLAPVNFKLKNLPKKYTDVSFREPIYIGIVVILSFMSIFSGKWFKSMFVLTDFNFISIHKEIFITSLKNRDFLFDKDWKFVAFFLTTHALIVAIYCIFYVRSNKTKIVWYLSHNYNLYLVFKFFNRKCYFDEIYNIFLARFFVKLSFLYNRAIEDGIFRSLLHFFYKTLKLFSNARIITKKQYVLDHIYVVSFSILFVFILAFCV